MDLAVLLGRFVPDPSAFVGRVLEPVQEKLLSPEMLSGESFTAPDELLAAALGSWLAKKFDDKDSPSPSVVAEFAEPDDPPPCDVLVERDRRLAAALGACQCWGEQPDCANCDGSGSPGWVRPDKQLFVEYVEPAIRVLTCVTDSSAFTEYRADRPS